MHPIKDNKVRYSEGSYYLTSKLTTVCPEKDVLLRRTNIKKKKKKKKKKTNNSPLFEWFGYLNAR